MTITERQNLLTCDFDYLWNELWGEYIGVQYRSEEKISRDKFSSLKKLAKLKVLLEAMETKKLYTQ